MEEYVPPPPPPEPLPELPPPAEIELPSDDVELDDGNSPELPTDDEESEDDNSFEVPEDEDEESKFESPDDDNSSQEGADTYDANSSQEGTDAYDANSSQEGTDTYDANSSQEGTDTYDANSSQEGADGYDANSSQEGADAYDANSSQEGADAYDANSSQEGADAYDANSSQEGADAYDANSSQEGADAYDANSSQEGADTYDANSSQEGADTYDANSSQEGTELFDDFICPGTLPDDFDFKDESDFIVELKDAIIILTEKEALMCMSDEEIDLSKISSEKSDSSSTDPSVSILDADCFLNGKLGVKDGLIVDNLMGDSRMKRDNGSVVQLVVGCKASLVSAKILDTRYVDINADAAKTEIKFVAKLGKSGIVSQVEAGVYLAEVSGKAGTDELSLQAKGKVGFGATGKLLFENGKVKITLGVAFMLGGEIAINIDFKKILELVHQEPDEKTKEFLDKYTGKPKYFDDFPNEWRSNNKIVVPINGGYYGGHTIEGKSVIYE